MSNFQSLAIHYLSLDRYENQEQFYVYCTLISMWLRRVIKLKYADHYKSLAYLLTLVMSIDDIKRCIQLTCVENIDYLKSLFKSRRFCGYSLDSFPVGISTLRGLVSMQDELNVKRIKTKSHHNETNNFKIIPKINVAIPADYRGYSWFRIKVADMNVAIETYNNFKKNIINDEYLEIYLHKAKKKELKDTIHKLNMDNNVERIVFCSNLRFIKTIDLPTAFANIFTFLFCYLMQTDDVYLSIDSMSNIYYYQQLAFLFLYTNNLNTIHTNSPLSVLASERNLTVMKNYNGIYPIESNRCNNVMSNYVNLGPFSTNDLIIDYKIDSVKNEYLNKLN